jgi:2-hydroxychromene-2-carboxylate isomerase
MKEITFYYDIVCPFAYVASRLIERLAERNAASIRWAPVLLGELIDQLNPVSRAGVHGHILGNTNWPIRITTDQM